MVRTDHPKKDDRRMSDLVRTYVPLEARDYCWGTRGSK